MLVNNLSKDQNHQFIKLGDQILKLKIKETKIMNLKN